MVNSSLRLAWFLRRVYRNRRLLALLALSAAFVSAVGFLSAYLFFSSFNRPPTVSRVVVSPITSCSHSEQGVVRIINEYRASAGVGQLMVNSLLTSSAIAKGKDMVVNGYWEHYSPSGASPWQFFEEAGYRYTHAGENLARYYKCDADVVAAWNHSPSHQKIMLNPIYREVGISWYDGGVVAHFGVR